MLKFVDNVVTFSEIPDEISLCINISNCPYRCDGCHSSYLWKDIGQELTKVTLVDLLRTNSGITTVCFMGGDNDLKSLYELFNYVLENYPKLKVAWYTGRKDFPVGVPKIHYIKIGPYLKDRGPITNPNTNQMFFTLGSVMKKMDANGNLYYDTTDKFWNKE